jgi:homocitrate synthase NifV
MNDEKLIWVDQTLNMGIRQGLRPDALASVAGLLTGLGINVFDVRLTAWQLYQHSLPECPFAPYIRCVIDPYLQEMRSAWQAGFCKVAVTCEVRAKREGVEPVLAFADENGMEVSLHIIDASEYEVEIVKEWAPLFEQYKVKSLIIGDRDSRWEPLRAAEYIGNILSAFTCTVGFHAHNRCGLATANSFAALRAGVKEVAVSIAGIGLQGHAALEEVMLGSVYLLKQPVPIKESLAADAAAIMKYFGYDIPLDKAVIGKYIFSHESGIHVNGIMKDSSLYEAFAPETVGLTRRIVLGKHSGTTSITAKCRELGLALDERSAKYLLKRIRKLAVSKKGLVEEAQLKRLYYRMTHRSRVRAKTREAYSLCPGG